LQYLPKQDIIYTIYKISKNPKHPAFKKLEKLLGIKITKPLNKKELIKILKEKYKENPKIMDEIFEFADKHLVRTTLALPDFVIDFDKELSDSYEENINTIKQVEEELKEKFPKADIVLSGARANFQQIRQISYSRGYVADFFGHVVDRVIKHGYIHGLTEEEFFYSAYGTRKSLLDTAFIVGDSGYLTRRLIYVSPNAKLDSDDCGTKYTFKIHVENKDIANRLKYRYYYEDNPQHNPDVELKRVDNPDDIIGKTIYVRSPIYCESYGICKTCYGDLHKIHKSTNVGFIAAQTLGERSTQLTLRTFHTGGVAEKKSADDKQQEDITTALKQVERVIDKSYPVHSHEEIHDMIMTLYNIFKDYSSMHLIHIETILSQMIFKFDGNNAILFKNVKDKDDFTNVKKVSSKNVPALISPLLAIFFEKPRRSIAKALSQDTNTRLSVLEKALLNLE
jgi:DNA-directed RNA polymerase beta' subunit